MAAPAGDEVPGARDVDDMVAEMSARMNALSARTERVMREQVPDPGAPSVWFDELTCVGVLLESREKHSKNERPQPDRGRRRWQEGIVSGISIFEPRSSGPGRPRSAAARRTDLPVAGWRACNRVLRLSCARARRAHDDDRKVAHNAALAPVCRFERPNLRGGRAASRSGRIAAGPPPLCAAAQTRSRRRVAAPSVGFEPAPQRTGAAAAAAACHATSAVKRAGARREQRRAAPPSKTAEPCAAQCAGWRGWTEGLLHLP